MLTFSIKSIKHSDLYNSLYTNSNTNGIQKIYIYTNLCQLIYVCLKKNLNIKNINLNTSEKPTTCS